MRCFAALHSSSHRRATISLSSWELQLDESHTHDGVGFIQAYLKYSTGLLQNVYYHGTRGALIPSFNVFSTRSITRRIILLDISQDRSIDFRPPHLKSAHTPRVIVTKLLD